MERSGSADTPEVTAGYLRRVPLLKDTDEKTRSRIASCSSIKSLDAQEVLHTSCDQCREISYVISGSLKIVRYAPSNQELVLKRVYQGDTFGEVIALSRERYPGWLIALEPAQILEIPIDEVLTLCSDRIIREQLLCAVSQKMLALSRRIELLSAGSMRARLSLYLLDLYGEKGNSELTLPMTVTELAVYLGCTRESLSRLFAKLEHAGVLIQRGRKIRLCTMDFFVQD